MPDKRKRRERERTKGAENRSTKKKSEEDSDTAITSVRVFSHNKKKHPIEKNKIKSTYIQGVVYKVKKKEKKRIERLSEKKEKEEAAPSFGLVAYLTLSLYIHSFFVAFLLCFTKDMRSTFLLIDMSTSLHIISRTIFDC